MKRTVVTTHPDGTQTVTEETVDEQKKAKLGCLGVIALLAVTFGPYAWGWPLWLAVLLSVLEGLTALGLLAVWADGQNKK